MTFLSQALIKKAFLLILISFLAQPIWAQIQLGNKNYGPKPVVDGLQVPWGMEWLGNDSILFSQIDGKVYLADLSSGATTTVLDLEVARENQAGLLDIKLSEDYKTSREIFVSYCYYQSTEIKMRLSSFKFQGASLGSERVLIDNLAIANANIGGRIAVQGNKVYFSVGDRRDASLAQAVNNLQGKILRINTDGSRPADNPIPGSLIWSYGHRNPQGLCWVDTILFSSEHGPSNNDELNLIVENGNYGWPSLTGKCPTSLKDTCINNGFIDPIFVWDPPVAPSGIDYYPDDGPIEAWRNSILIASLRGQSLESVSLTASKDEVTKHENYIEGLVGRIREVLVTDGGRVFISSSNEDIYGTSRLGGDKIFEITEGFTYEPPTQEVDTTLDQVIKLDQTVLQTRVIAKNLRIPWDLDMDYQGMLWFSERDGSIKKLDPSNGNIEEVFKIEEVYESEDNSGLHAMALHPRFPIVPYVFVNYTYTLYGARLVRYTYSIGQKTFIDSTHLISHIPANITHNGSRIVFESDSIMLVSLGDGFTGIEPQQITSNVGKILRMTINGGVPKDNPFEGSYTWSLGHRNPQGLSFGKNGLLYSSEHGVATDDELNLIEKGRNYGWPIVEGYCDFVSEQNFCDSAKVREPLLAWTPTEAPCGLAYFDHPSIPEWQESLLQSFLKNKELTLISLSEDGRSVISQEDFLDRTNAEGKKVGVYGRLRDVFVAPNGKIYIATSNQEANGQSVLKEDDDKIIELFNPDYSYESNEKALVEAHVRAFPNPVSSFFFIQVLESGQHTFRLSDNKGAIIFEEVYESSAAGELVYFERKNQGPGLYFLSVSGDFKTETIKLVFE